MMGGQIWARVKDRAWEVFSSSPCRTRREKVSTKILIIEDNKQNMYLLTFLLNSHGHEVIQAFDGFQGIESAKDEHPDLILLDIQLPEIDGYSVAREIRAIGSLRETPIVAVTSYAMVGDREKALAAGCSGYIEKPINPGTFVDQISQFLPGIPRKNGGDL
jgi:CheY-like chemotaxis protein